MTHYMTGDQVSDFSDRLERAADNLFDMGNKATEYAEQVRLHGKGQGVRLAMSYLQEYQRQDEA